MRLGLFFVAALTACGGELAPTGDGGTSSPDATRPPGISDGGARGPDSGVVTSCLSGCPFGEYCQIDKTCNKTGGTCVAGPMGCTLELDYVCGTDGKTYPNECTAHAAGVDITENGNCPEPQGWVACGPHFCSASAGGPLQNYCAISGNDAPGPGQPCASYECRPLPSGCAGSSDCACLKQLNLCGMCKYTGNGFQVTCPGG